MRSPSTRLGKNGGTQSKCVDSTTTGASAAVVARTLNRWSSTGCSMTVNAVVAKIGGEPAAGVAFAAGRGVDVDQAAREADEIDARWRYRIHASSSVRVSVRESRYFTITGVASDRPHSGPFADA